MTRKEVMIMPKLQFQAKDKQGKLRNTGSMEIKNMTTDSAELYFYGDIVSDNWGKWSDDDKCPNDIAEFLKDLEEVNNINIHMNSGGGSVFAGIAIYNQLKRYNATVTTYIDGIAASIASVIAMAGDRIIMPRNATLMIHKPMNSIWAGNADDFRKEADTLDTCQKNIVTTYMTKVKEGVTEEQINELVNAETWFTGDDISEIFDIEVEESNQAAACTSDFYGKYLHTPDNLKKKETAMNANIDMDAIADKLFERINAVMNMSVGDSNEQLKTDLLRDLDQYGR